jgi:hypothetical protein
MTKLTNKYSNPCRVKWIVLVLAIGVLLANCGVKAPPIPPNYTPPPAVTNLGYTLEADGSVRLSWRLSGKERPKGAKLQGARIYRSKDSLEKPACEDCPRIFNVAKDLPLAQNNMFFREPLQKGFRYAYKIVVYDETNQESPDSNVVSFEYQ